MATDTPDIPTLSRHIQGHQERFTIFRGLTPPELERILALTATTYQPPDKILFRKGQPAREMYIIIRGRVDIVDTYKHKHKVIAVLREGEVFGEMALFGDHGRTASARTSGAVGMLALDEKKLYEVVSGPGGPIFIMNLLRVLSERLDSMTHKYMRERYAAGTPDSPMSRWID